MPQVQKVEIAQTDRNGCSGRFQGFRFLSDRLSKRIVQEVGSGGFQSTLLGIQVGIQVGIHDKYRIKNIGDARPKGCRSKTRIYGNIPQNQGKRQESGVVFTLR